MTGRYSIRSGLSLIAVEGTAISLPATEITMAEVLRNTGYATAIFGKWHLGAEPYSQPQNKGFDEFYGIPPGDTWDAFLMIPQGLQTKSLDVPLDKGPFIVEAKQGEPLKPVKPYTAEVRREIDWELVDHGIDFIKRQKTAGKPFFLYMPISRTHFPNLPSKRFEGQSRIGQFGDSLMEADAIVGAMLDALKSLGLEDDTIVVFASDNGPQFICMQTGSSPKERERCAHPWFRASFLLVVAPPRQPPLLGLLVCGLGERNRPKNNRTSDWTWGGALAFASAPFAPYAALSDRALWGDLKMSFRLIHANYDKKTRRAYVELRQDDVDGDEMIVAAIFSYRRTSIITKKALEYDLATKARYLMKRAAVGLDSPA